jgi:hypothetical protein
MENSDKDRWHTSHEQSVGDNGVNANGVLL